MITKFRNIDLINLTIDLDEETEEESLKLMNKSNVSILATSLNIIKKKYKTLDKTLNRILKIEGCEYNSSDAIIFIVSQEKFLDLTDNSVQTNKIVIFSSSDHLIILE